MPTRTPLPLSRRAGLASLLSVGLLAGCGFKLRGSTDLVLKSLHINGSEDSSLLEELRRTLAGMGQVRVQGPPASPQGVDAVLDLLADQREKTVVGVSASGQVREFQLRVRLRYRLRTPAGRELLPETELLLQRDISFNETAALAKEAEEGLMFRDMQTDIVQQLIRRLAAVRSL